MTGWERTPDELWTFEGRLYVPREPTLREKVIHDHHDSPLAGHPGNEKTLELVLRDYWWPSVKYDVRKYVEGCTTCQ